MKLRKAAKPKSFDENTAKYILKLMCDYRYQYGKSDIFLGFHIAEMIAEFLKLKIKLKPTPIGKPKNG